MIEVIGTIGTLLLAVGFLDELRITVKRGYSTISPLTLFIFIFGFIFMATYACVQFGWDWILMFNYILNIILVSGLIKYRFWPKN